MKPLQHAFRASLNTTSTSRNRCADAHFLPGCLPKLAHPDRGLDGLRDRVDRPAPPIQWKKVPVSEIQDIRTSSRNAEKQCLSQKVCYPSTWARKLRYITFIYNLACVSDMERCCLVIASAVSVPISVSISVSVSVPLVPCLGLGRMRLKSNSAAMGTNECATEQD